MGSDDEFIWMNRWDEFQTFHRKKGKPWSPPWIKTYLAQLRDDRYLGLTDRQRSLLHDLRMVFAVTLGRLPRSTPVITNHRHRQTFRRDLEALSDAGFIEVCSKTEMERRRSQFWNTSETEVEVEEERDKPSLPTSTYNGTGEPAELASRYALVDALDHEEGRQE